MHVRDWAPDIDRWPRSWIGIREDLEYGKRLLPYLEEFLQDILEGGVSLVFPLFLPHAKPQRTRTRMRYLPLTQLSHQQNWC